jgi:hypothetical protein
MKDYYKKYYGFMEGAKIVEAGVVERDDEIWPHFVIEKDGEKFHLDVSQDEEGNGPGYIFGLPIVE